MLFAQVLCRLRVAKDKAKGHMEDADKIKANEELIANHSKGWKTHS